MNRNHLILVFTLVFSTSVFAQTNEEFKYVLDLAKIQMWKDAFATLDDLAAEGHFGDAAFYDSLALEALRQGDTDASAKVEARRVHAVSPAGVPCTPISPPANNQGLDSTHCVRYRPGVVAQAVDDMNDEYANAFDDDDGVADIIRRLSLNGADISN